VDSAGDLRFYDLSGSTLVGVATPVACGAGPWGLAVGKLEPSPALADVVVTSASDGTIVIAKDGGLGVLSSASTSVGVAPVAPSIGRLWNGAAAGQNQIAVGDAGPATSTVRVLDGSGAELAGYLVTAVGGGAPSASAIGDVLPSLPVSGRDELVVSFTNEGTGSSSVIVVPQLSSGSGLDYPAAAIEMASGAGTHTLSLLAADVDNDGLAELVAGYGGTWAQTSSAAAPFVQIWHSATGGASFQAAETHVGGGTELAGAAPSLALADFGAIFPSRHPIDEVAAAHVSTETAPFDRHVTCSDCHNSHEATTAVAVAPLVSGQMKGAWGVAVTYPDGVPIFGAPAQATNGYEICFKCHSSYTALGGRPDDAAEFAPTNASLHSVSTASTSTVPAGTFVAGWTASSILNCTDCHGDDGRTGAQARGLHESASAPILIAPYLGASPADADLLCYDCHKYTVYGTGADDAPTGMSFFQRTSPGIRLHSSHVASVATGGHGLACSACHVSHGSATNPHLLRDDIGFTSTGADAGVCSNGCHSAPHSWPLP